MRRKAPIGTGPWAPKARSEPLLHEAVLVSFFETVYVARLGSATLAGMAFAMPLAVLQISLSNGAMGGGVSPRPSVVPLEKASPRWRARSLARAC